MYPSQTIKVWADNGYGRMVSRRQGNRNPRIPALPYPGDAEPHGVYYHCSFHDLQASNHLTMSPNPAEFLAAELGNALKAGAGEYWIVNCGSVKPHIPMLDLIRETWRNGPVDVQAWRKGYVTMYYGEENAGALAALFGEYAACTAKYGPNDDDRAGEQIWHHPVRELLRAWMSGKTDQCVQPLIWLAGDAPFTEQIKKLETICRNALPGWEVFCKKCADLRPGLNEAARRLFDDSLYLSARIQRYGVSGAVSFCESFSAYSSGDTARAFLLAHTSHSAYTASVNALTEAEHDTWAGYYAGDCLTDVRLDALVSYLRVLGDGPDFHTWERRFLTPAAEQGVMLLSSKQRALSNGELALEAALVTTEQVPGKQAAS
jgi:hypothetical protein